MKKYWQALIAFLLVILINSVVSSWAYSQENGSPENNGNKIDGFAVTLADETLFVIQANVNSFSSEERAQTITNRLEKIAEDASVDLNQLRIEEQDIWKKFKMLCKLTKKNVVLNT